jgi:hypothetical protein
VLGTGACQMALLSRGHLIRDRVRAARKGALITGKGEKPVGDRVRDALAPARCHGSQDYALSPGGPQVEIVTSIARAAIPPLFAGLLVPSQAVGWRRAVQQMVTQPLQYRYGEAEWGAQEGGGQSFRRRRLRWHLRESPDALTVLSPFGMRWIGQEDADALDDDGPPWHALVIAAVQEGGGDQEGFERIGDAGVMAEVQQPVDAVLDVPAVLSEEAVAEVFEGLAAGSRLRAFAIQEMILELQQADRAVAGSEGRDSLVVQ